MKIPQGVKIVIVILITVALAEVAPEAVNYILLLILIGVILGNWQEFSGLASVFSSLEA
jgi:hypothetical protein